MSSTILVNGVEYAQANGILSMYDLNIWQYTQTLSHKLFPDQMTTGAGCVQLLHVITDCNARSGKANSWGLAHSRSMRQASI